MNGREVLGGTVNKTDLINQLAARLEGDKKVAQTAVEGMIDLIQREVQRGENVSISGFGVFEKRARAARTARNPRTGQAVKVKKTTVPAFRPGKYFKDVIAGVVKLPKVTAKPTTARAAAAAAKTPVAVKAAPAAPRARAAAKPAAVAAAVKAPRVAAVKVAPVKAVAAVKAPRVAAVKAAPVKVVAAVKASAAKAPVARKAPVAKKK